MRFSNRSRDFQSTGKCSFELWQRRYQLAQGINGRSRRIQCKGQGELTLALATRGALEVARDPPAKGHQL